MSRFATEKKRKKRTRSTPMTLIYAARDKKSAAYLEDVQELADRNPYLTLKSVFGRIDERLIQTLARDTGQCVWHVAGPPPMVDYVRNILFLMGIEDSRICFEEFVGY
jgi:ferredoxin-NADP reductase